MIEKNYITCTARYKELLKSLFALYEMAVDIGSGLRILRFLEEARCRAMFYQVPHVKECYMVGKPLCLSQDVGNKDYRVSILKLKKLAFDALRRNRIERRCGLVAKDDLGLDSQAARKA